MTALTGTVNASGIWGVLALSAPFIGAMVLVAFAYRSVKKTTKGASKGKVNF